MKKIVAIAMSVILGAGLLLTGCGKKDGTVIRVGALSGPTAMGMAKLMDDAAQGKTENTYEFADLSGDASALVAPLAKGELDIAAIPSNLAANLYNNTDGSVEVLAAGVLGVLYLVERGNSMQTLNDISGKTVYATGEGSVPEYVLRYILTSKGIDPDADVTIDWCGDTAEALARIQNDDTAVAMLPQPFVTVALSKVDDLRIVSDLNAEWADSGTLSQIVTGVVVVRREFAQQHPELVETFLQEYESSVQFVNENPEEAGQMIADLGIVGSAAVAAKAIPDCHLTCYTAEDMQLYLNGFLEILYEQNPMSVGGALPDDGFYYR